MADTMDAGSNGFAANKSKVSAAAVPAPLFASPTDDDPDST